MDGLSVAASVIAVIQISASIVTVCQEYYSEVKNAAKSAQRILQGVMAFQGVLEQLRDLADSLKNDPKQLVTLSLYLQANSLLDQCETELTNLNRQLDPTIIASKGKYYNVFFRPKLRKKLTWPLEKKDIEASLQSFERLKSALSLALNIDQSRQLAGIESVIKNDQLMFRGDIGKLVKSSETAESIQHRQDITKWLAAPNASSNHHRSQEKRTESTCEWFASDNQFIKWTASPNSFFWLHGISGCGKTILSSAVIDELEEYAFENQVKKIAVTFFYFDFRAPEMTEGENMLRGICAQLLSQAEHIPKEIDSLYARSHKGARQPGRKELKSCMKALISGFDEVYIAVDALNECAESSRSNLLLDITDVMSWNSSNLHVFVTSTQDNEIEQCLGGLGFNLAIETSSVEADIGLMVRTRLTSESQFKKFASKRDDIEKAVFKQADGMFLWASCQLDEIARCPNISTLEKLLVSMPKTITEMYKCMLESVTEIHREFAMKAFCLLISAKRPLRIEEVAQMIAIPIQDGSKFNLENDTLLDPMEIFSYCSGLIRTSTTELIPVYLATSNKVVGYESGQATWLELAHFSVLKFLQSDKVPSWLLESSRVADEIVTRCCLGMLLHFDQKEEDEEDEDTTSDESTRDNEDDEDDGISTKTTTPEDDDATEELACIPDPLNLLDPRSIKKYPFAPYAAQYWVYHFTRHSDANEETLISLVLQLFYISKSPYINWLRLFSLSEPVNSPRTIYRGYTPAPLYMASITGLTSICSALLSKGHNVNEQGGRLGNPLQASVYSGNIQTVRLLLAHKADVNRIGGIFLSAFQASVTLEYEDIQDLLEEHGANINAGEMDLDAFFSISRTYPCSGRGKMDDAPSSRIKSFPKFKPPKKNATALQAAAFNGLLGQVKRLVGKGANIHARAVMDELDGRRKGAGKRFTRSAVELAVEAGHMNVVSYLLEQGASLERRYSWPSCLEIACQNRDEEMVKLLLASGAKIGGGRNTRTHPLLEAINQGSEEIVQLLLDHGAEIPLAKTTESGSGSPLYAAAAKGNEKLVRRFVELGYKIDADPEPKKNDVDSPEESMPTDNNDLLAENDDESDAESQHSTSSSSYGPRGALNAAVSNNHPSIVQYLIQHGAKLNINQGDALETAAGKGYFEIVQILLDAGAKTDISSYYFSRPLYQAIEKGHEEIAMLLIERGANINGTYEEGKQRPWNELLPLELAVQNQHETIAKKLIGQGALLTSQLLSLSLKAGLQDLSMQIFKTDSWKPRKGTYELLYASAAGFTEIVAALLEYGVDPNFVSRVHDGECALTIAARCGNEDIVDLLLGIEGLELETKMSERGNEEVHYFYEFEDEVVEGFEKEKGGVLEGEKEKEDALDEEGEMVAADVDEEILTTKEGAVNEDANEQRGEVTKNDIITPTEYEEEHGQEKDEQEAEEQEEAEQEEANPGWYPCSPLRAAASRGHLSIITKLILAGAKLDLVTGYADKWGSPGYDKPRAGTPLQTAITEGQNSAVELLIRSGAGPNALYEALAAESDILQMLLEHGADTKSKDGQRALGRATIEGDVESVRLLLKYGAWIKESEENEDLLSIAATSGFADLVSIFLDLGAKLPSAPSDETLHVAAARGHEDVVKLLLPTITPSQIHNLDSQNQTLLQAAVSGQCNRWGYSRSSHEPTRTNNKIIRIFQLLLDYGADINVQSPVTESDNHQHYNRDKSSLTVLEASLNCEDWKWGRVPDESVALFLLDKGAVVLPRPYPEVEVPDSKSEGHSEVSSDAVQELNHVSLNLNPPPEPEVTSSNEAPLDHGHELRLAINRNWIKVCTLLLLQGADPNAPSSIFQTPLHLSITTNNPPLTHHLLQHAAVPNPILSKDSPFSPLHLAAWHGHLEICKILLEAGAEVNTVAVDSDPNAWYQKYYTLQPRGKNALQAAIFGKHFAVMEILKGAGAHNGGEELVDLEKGEEAKPLRGHRWTHSDDDEDDVEEEDEEDDGY